MLFSNNCRFALFFFLSLSASANSETIRGAHRELDAATPSTIHPVRVDIGSVITNNYAILAKSGISTVPTSVITGNIGVSPIAATAMTGFSLLADSGNQFSTSAQVVGTDNISGQGNKAYAASYGGATAVALTTAVSDMETAYTFAAGQSTSAGKLNLGTPVAVLGSPPPAGALGASGTEVLSRGVYTFGSSLTIAADFSFKGSDTDIFIIQISGDLLQVANTRVTLVSDGLENANGVTGTFPLASNIFWQVAGQVVVQADAHMEGILLVKTAVTFQANSSLNGRVLTQTRCDLDKAIITA
jgi:hypothetical protein